MAEYSFGLSEFFSEAYRVEQTVEARCDKGSFRVEAVAVLRGPNTDYTARYYQLIGGKWQWVQIQQVLAGDSDEAIHMGLANLETYLKGKTAD